MTEVAAPRGAVRRDERALAPDLARGMMLLLIVMSNTAFHLWGSRHGPSGWHPVDGAWIDRATQFVMIVALDLRVYPLFAFLLAYGMVQLYERQLAARPSGTEPTTVDRRRAVSLLRRRSLWLLVFGFVHAALFLAGDILGHYGLVTLFLGWLLIRRGNRTLYVALGITAVLWLLPLVDVVRAFATGDLGGPGAFTEPTVDLYAAGETDWLTAAGRRLQTWAWVAAVGAFAWIAMPQLVVAFLAARHGVLERPGDHLRLLRWTAVLGIAVGWAGGLPLALAHVGAIDVPSGAVAESGVLPVLAEVTGIPGGLGYVALFGLVAHRLSRRERQPAVAALGRRSLSGYLAHSVVFAPVLAAWGLGLGAHLGSAGMALFAVGVWLVSVAGAVVLDRRGLPGPAEWLLRRLVYGRRPPRPAGVRPD
jgi:uncharacterized membrane protein YeiB